MPIIDITYFRGRITLGNVATGSDALADTDLVDVYIPDMENEYLLKALGYPLYAAFIAGIAEEEPAQKWLDLRDGKEYTVNDKGYKWGGFANSEKQSPIAYYVYAEYQTNYATNTANTGELLSQVQNATNTSPAQKIFKAWVEMKQLNSDLYHYLNEYKVTYPEYDTTRVQDFGSRNTHGI
jgi:hypothetical protein